jgi:sulfite exporter TauE/SafE/copper chaperone CopZ
MAKQQLQTCEFFVAGMHCAACELVIEKKLAKVAGVHKVDAKLAEHKVYITTERELNAAELTELIREDGYQIVAQQQQRQINWRELGVAFVIATAIAVALAKLLEYFQAFDTLDAGTITLPFIFFVGVVASLSTCMAVVGGLVLSISTNYAKENQAKPLLAFHLARLGGFFVLGGVIGAIGSTFQHTSITIFVMNLILFIVMVLMGINLLDIWAGSGKYQLKMPKAIGKRVLALQDNQTKWTPILLGIATFVLPCGFTISMQNYALSTGSAIEGAVIMLVYALGTLPVLALISFGSVQIAKSLQAKLFFKVAGFLVIFFALFNLNIAVVAIKDVAAFVITTLLT